jgi:(2S)-methylsuccinyl-CoA dehydrogenase
MAATISHAIETLDQIFAQAKAHLLAQVSENGKISAKKLDAHQMAAHALAYLATEIAAVKQLAAWELAVASVKGGEASTEKRLVRTYTAELLRQLRAGVNLGQTENVSLAELGISATQLLQMYGPELTAFADAETTYEAYAPLALAEPGAIDAFALDDETLSAMRKEFRRFVDREVKPLAQDIHRKDVLIPMELITKMAELGVFGLTIPEEHGGLGLSKVAMCLVTEELSRGYIGVGSLGTRSEIAAELILAGGTQAQKEKWLPLLASGEIIPTAVFTEPNTGSDLARLGTRAVKEGDSWVVRGQKTWITHAARADLMTLLVRTKEGEPGYAGLSMLLAPKTRREDDFVDPGLSGTEISVLGYRGMKEYELSFDGFTVPAENLLGEKEGLGFKQLMTTFESARIQTAARGVGLAQAALDEAASYARERIQFGQPILGFPRVARKLARMVCTVQAARVLTHYAATRKDSGDRCDLEAGMAKLLATRAAWEAADAGVQIHGGNGYAEEYTASRLLVDSRVLSIFEGANEIQAHVVARRLLEI